MSQRIRYYTFINKKGQIKFTGTADDAVEKGISVSKSAFSTVVQTYIDGKLLKTQYPYDENFMNVSKYAMQHSLLKSKEKDLPPLEALALILLFSI